MSARGSLRVHRSDGGATARNSPHLPSWREARAVAEFPCARMWRRRNPAAGTGSLARIPAPHFPSKIYRNLPNNPGNLSNFSEIFGNSVSAGEATGAFMIPEPPEAARTANADKYALVPSGAKGMDRPRREGVRGSSSTSPTLEDRTRIETTAPSYSGIGSNMPAFDLDFLMPS